MDEQTEELPAQTDELPAQTDELTELLPLDPNGKSAINFSLLSVSIHRSYKIINLIKLLINSTSNSCLSDWFYYIFEAYVSCTIIFNQNFQACLVN